MNVYPRKPLKAVREQWRDTVEWSVVPEQYSGLDDAEFAEHFYPAEQLDTLLAAVQEWDATHNFEGETVLIDFDAADAAEDALTATFRAFREQETA